MYFFHWGEEEMTKKDNCEISPNELRDLIYIYQSKTFKT